MEFAEFFQHVKQMEMLPAGSRLLCAVGCYEERKVACGSDTTFDAIMVNPKP